MESEQLVKALNTFCMFVLAITMFICLGNAVVMVIQLAPKLGTNVAVAMAAPSFGFALVPMCVLAICTAILQGKK